jgi:hypothetical protein
VPGMTTSRITSVAVAITALALGSTSAPTGGVVLAPTALASRIEHPAPEPKERYAYAWPVKPFRHQHPVRGFFGDPRIANDGESRQFHFGIDVSAPNGTPVYATLTGTAYIHPLHSTTIGIVGQGGAEFSYWHVVPTVRTGQWVVAYRTVIGHIEEPYGHVHFSEKRDGRYLNPLRRGALGPYTDDTRPTVRSVRVVAGELVAETYDETPIAVPRPWYDLPVMPALVRWHVVDGRGVAHRWQTVVDFRTTIPSASAFDEVWAPGTTQNHVRAPGHYRLVLTHSLHGLPAGRFEVDVAVRDTRGNGSVRGFAFDLSKP